MARWCLLAFGFVVACAAEPAATSTKTKTKKPTVFGSDDDAGVVADCSSDGIKDVFVISEQNSLYTFAPTTLKFTELGALACPTPGAFPTSMAVDRQGYAWVRFSDTKIWRVHTTDLKCTATPFVAPAEEKAFHKFGMGFSKATTSAEAEELFLSDTSGGGLGRLDTKTMTLTSLGLFTGPLAGFTGELTGTGDGKLYGFFTTSPAQVAELSKTNGQTLSSKVLPTVLAGDAWAFSFYGGDFYVYTHVEDSPQGSVVTRYRPSDGTVTPVVADVGFKIVGAGVSTCAPTVAPH